MDVGDQFTVPLEDTVAMDSPILETQLETLDFNTEVLDTPDYVGKTRDQTVDDVVEDSVKDSVLDSDEEGNEVVSMASGLSMKETKTKNAECASDTEERSRTFPGYIRRQARKVWAPSLQLPPSSERILIDEHCNAGQPGPAFYHAGAIYQWPLLVSGSGISRVEEKTSHDQIDQMDISYVDKNHRWQCTEKLRKRTLAVDFLNEEKSSPTNCEIMDKARDVSFAASCHGVPSITFAGSQEPEEPSEVNALSFIDRFVSVNNLPLSEKFGSEMAKGTKSPPISRAKGVQTLTKRAHSGAKGSNPGIFDWADEQSSENNFAKELDERCDMRSVWQHLEKDESGINMPEVFDIGFDTQMAAEAMEALLHADPSHSNARYEVSEDTIANPPGTGLPRNVKSSVSTHHDMAGSNSKITVNHLENTMAANNLHGSISCSFEEQSGSRRKSTSLSPSENNVVCREPMKAKSFSEHPVSMKKNKNNSRVFGQKKKDETPERHNLKEDSKFVECKFHGGHPRKSSRAIKRTKYLSSMGSLERPKDPVSSFKRKRSYKLEFNATAAKRNKKSIKVEVQKKLGVRGNYFELGSDAADVTTVKSTWHNKFALVLNGTTSSLELGLWNYPKGKRTQRKLAHPSTEGSNPWTWFPVNGVDNYTIQNRKTAKWMCGLVASGQLKSQCFTETRRSVTLSKQRSAEKSSPGFGNCESAITSEQMSPTELEKGKSSKQSSRIDGKDSVSVYSESIKLDAVADDSKASETSKIDEDYKKSGKLILSKASLTKVVTRLGYNKSLPDFLPREARRQNRATVCVLFSQHLELDIINQQKSIISRLGFSVASCCSNATHFITDRFLRTRNMLEAIASGKPVVTPLWLESCRRATYHIHEKNYILRDAKKEKENGFSMPVSLASAKQRPLLKGRRVLITSNIKPGKELIQSLVKAVHGKEIKKIQRVAQKKEIISNDVLILSSEGDFAACKPFLERGAAVYDSEMLLNGIVIQKLEYERHLLFATQYERKGFRAVWRKT